MFLYIYKDFFNNCRDYIFGRKKHSIVCLGCKKLLKFETRSPRLKDNGEVARYKCENCNSITTVSYHVSIATGYGKG